MSGGLGVTCSFETLCSKVQDVQRRTDFFSSSFFFQDVNIMRTSFYGKEKRLRINREVYDFIYSLIERNQRRFLDCDGWDMLKESVRWR